MLLWNGSVLVLILVLSSVLFIAATLVWLCLLLLWLLLLLTTLGLVLLLLWFLLSLLSILLLVSLWGSSVLFLLRWLDVFVWAVVWVLSGLVLHKLLKVDFLIIIVFVFIVVVGKEIIGIFFIIVLIIIFLIWASKCWLCFLLWDCFSLSLLFSWLSSWGCLLGSRLSLLWLCCDLSWLSLLLLNWLNIFLWIFLILIFIVF